MKEVHLLIIWSKALNQKDKILSSLSRKFDILEIINVTWSLNKFSENLSRFYGENLPKSSHKEKHCGNGPFTCIIVRDNNPVYDVRKTLRGPKVVNVNLFDAKQVYRNWTGGGHKIHATDNVDEARLQLALLFGKDYNNYLNARTDARKEKTYNKDLVGANGWESFEQLFGILNIIPSKYVILRNFKNLDKQLTTLHPDVDLLVEDKNLFVNILNAKPTSSKKYRVQYSVIVNGRKVNFDLRYVGDNYYCTKWEREILETRKKHEYYYIPNKEMLFYSLLYHMLIHKPSISKDYIDELRQLSNQVLGRTLEMADFVESNLLNLLLSYMDKNNFSIVEPADLTVFFNHALLSKKIVVPISNRRKIKNFHYFIRLKLKSLISKTAKRVIK